MISRLSPSNAPAAVANANFGSSTWKTPALTAGARGRRQQRRIRLGIQIAPVVAARLRSTRDTIPHNDEIATLTAELDEDSAVRLLAASDSPNDQGQACGRAAALAMVDVGLSSRREAGWPLRRLDELPPVLSENLRRDPERRICVGWCSGGHVAALVGAGQVQRLGGDVVEDHFLRERGVAQQPRLPP
jgi:hypothetical protein